MPVERELCVLHLFGGHRKLVGHRAKLLCSIEKQLAELVAKKPLVAQIYLVLVLDGERTQRDVAAELAAYGIDVHEATLSRHITREMLSKRGLVELVDAGASKVYAKNREMNEVLNLIANMRKWLEESGQTVPLSGPKRRRKA